MTERQYESSVPDDLSGDTLLPSATGDGSSNYTGPGSPTTGGVTSSKPGSTADMAGSEAKSVASDAVDSGRQVADTAAAGVKDVAAEATTQLRHLFDQARAELDVQASSQGQRAVSGLRSLAEELRQMASTSQQQGLGREVATQAADRAGTVADWLDNKAPGDMLDEMRSLARRRPGAFLLGAAVLGLVGGRMTRGLTGDSGDATGAARVGGGGNGIAALQRSNGSAGAAAPLPPSPGTSSVAREPYSVGVRDSDTHSATSMTEGATSGPLDDVFTEGRGGVR